MPPEIYVITGATGNIGRRVCEIMVQAGCKVRAVGRNFEKLHLLPRKVEIFQGLMDDQGTMTRAFTGAKAVFTMIPPNYKAENMRMYQNRVSQVYQASIIGAGVRTAVNLSSLGAHLSDGVGPVNGLHDHEERFNRLDAVDILHLRPCYFMENHLVAMEMAKKLNLYGSVIKPDLRFPMIATRDIPAEVAARLIAMDFKGKSMKEMVGPKEYSMAEITRTIAPLMEKPELAYVQFSPEDAEKGMMTMGFSKDSASQMIQLAQAINEGRFKPSQPKSLLNTTTLFEDLAKELFHPLRVSRGKAAKKK
jgi:uncharacterized protein YbjT (DUF2867 family)